MKMIPNNHLEDPIIFPVAEPPNRAVEEEYLAYEPPTGPANGEDNSREVKSDDVFSDTGGTVQGFNVASKQVAQVLKHTSESVAFDSDKDLALYTMKVEDDKF